MKKTHVIHFELNGGAPDLEDLVVGDNKKIETPLVSKPPYKFLGWFEDKKLTKEFSDDTRITEDLTLYAGWGHNVTLAGKDKSTGRVGGGYVGANSTRAGMLSQSFLDGKKITISAEPMKEYVFVGWSDGEEIISTDIKYSIVVDKPVNLTAYFEKK